mmetsp:Transcript_40922/g.73540  ORF Transcript_40922/g.73540 Transcript_40922/m.73540 type:complete len:419 (+) Transcript_40922:69-1325(+)
MKAFVLAIAALIAPSSSLPGLHAYVTTNSGILSQPRAVTPAQQLLNEAQSLERAVEDEPSATPPAANSLSLMQGYGEPRPALTDVQAMMPATFSASRQQAVEPGSATLPLASAMDMHDQISALQLQVQSLSAALQRERNQAAAAEERQRKVSAKAQKLSMLAASTAEEDAALRQQLQEMEARDKEWKKKADAELQQWRKQAETAKAELEAERVKEHEAQIDAQNAKEAEEESEEALEMQQQEFKSQAAAVIKAADQRVKDAEAHSAKATSLAQQASSMVKDATAKADSATKAAEQKAASAAALQERLERSEKQIAVALQRTKERVAQVVESAREHQQRIPEQVPMSNFQTPRQDGFLSQAPMRPRENQMSLQTATVRKRVHAPTGHVPRRTPPNYEEHMPVSYERLAASHEPQREMAA